MNRKSTAIHEAGHAVIGRVLGLTCGPATIVPNQAKETAGVAIVQTVTKTASDWDQKLYEYWRSGSSGPAPKCRDHRSAFRAAILTHMAGAEAENVILGQNRGGDGSDRLEIAKLSDELGFSEAEWWERYESRMRRQVRRLVSNHRDKIERVALALLEHQTLSAAEIDAVLSTCGSC